MAKYSDDFTFDPSDGFTGSAKSQPATGATQAPRDAGNGAAFTSGLTDAARDIGKGAQRLYSDIQGKAKGGRVRARPKANY